MMVNASMPALGGGNVATRQRDRGSGVLLSVDAVVRDADAISPPTSAPRHCAPPDGAGATLAARGRSTGLFSVSFQTNVASAFLNVSRGPSFEISLLPLPGFRAVPSVAGRAPRSWPIVRSQALPERLNSPDQP